MFAKSLTDDYKQQLVRRGPMTYSQLMRLHFPHSGALIVSSTENSAVAKKAVAETPSSGGGSIDSEAVKQARYTEAAGGLSPEELRRVFAAQAGQRRAPTEEQLVAAMQTAALVCPGAAYCRGLTAMELEGLRRVWTALHPKVVGPLSDSELRLLYRWSHPSKPELTAARLSSWKAGLEVRGKGKGVGWCEFCYPYARRALLQTARDELSSAGLVVPARAVSRAVVESLHGTASYNDCFLPQERSVPLERVVAHFLRTREEAAAVAPSTTTASTPLVDAVARLVRRLCEEQDKLS